MAPLKVIIVGGGLGGSLLANGLLNNGVDVILNERDEEHSKREGYQIRLGDSAAIGMKACLEPSHLEDILGRLGRSTNGGSTAPVVYNTRFQPLVDLSTLPNYSKTSAINRVVLRNLLIQPVVDKSRVRFCKSFASYEIFQDETGQEKVRVLFADGSSDVCDVLVGADGSSSKINKQLGLGNLVPLDSHWGFLKKGSLPVERMRMLPKRLQKGPMLVFKGGAVMFYALYLPTPSGKANAAKADEIDYDSEAASYYWALNIPRAATKVQNPAELEDKLGFCLEFTKSWAPEFHSMLTIGESDKDAKDIMVIPLRASTKPSSDWRRKASAAAPGDAGKGNARVWLLGDAIHAMQPNRGQGGNQAMHDCAEMLGPLLSLHAARQAGQSLSTEQVKRALDEYEPKMIERTFYWVRASGGASVPSWDLDGYLGTVLSVLGWVFLPVARLMYGLFAGKDGKA